MYTTHPLLSSTANNPFLEWPDGFMASNIGRDNYRNGSTYHAIRNGEMPPAAQDLPEYKQSVRPVHRGVRTRVAGVRHDRGPKPG